MKFHLENPAAVPALTKTARIAILSSYKRTNEPALPPGGADARPCFIPLGRRRNKTGAYFFTVGGRTLDQRKPRDAGGVCDLCDLQYSGDDRTFLLYSCGHVFRRAGLRRGGLTALNLALPAYSLMHGLGLMTGMEAQPVMPSRRRGTGPPGRMSFLTPSPFGLDVGALSGRPV